MEIKPEWRKWIIFYIIGVILFSTLAKILDILSNDLMRIILNSIFTGIGTAIGMYIGGGLIVEKMFKKKEKDKD